MDRPLLIIFTIISIVLGAWALHKLILTKIGLRNISRRWTNTILIIIGSMVGTALISGSLVMSDSMDKTFENYVKQQSGEIDLTINFTPKKEFASSFANITENDYQDISRLLKDTKIDGILPSLQLAITPVKLDLQNNAVMNAYNVALHIVDINKLNLFGSTPQHVKALSKDEIALSKSVAKALDAQIGDQILFPLTQDISFTKKVASIYDQGGLLGGQTILMSPQGLPSQLKAGDLVYNEIILSAKGGAVPAHYDGKIFTEDVKNLLNSYENQNFTFQLNESKQEALDGFGLKLFVQTFLVLSIFGSFTGVLLIINLYQMLAAERQTEMGIMRAIGFTRLSLTKIFVIEGYIYSVLSSFLGSFVGIGLGYLLIIPLSGLFDVIFKFGNRQGFEILFDFKISTLFISFSTGAIITIITVILSSWHTSNLNIVVAIRHIKEFKLPKMTLKWILTNLLLLIFFISSIVSLVVSFFIRTYLTNLRNIESKNNYITNLHEKEFQSLLDMSQGFLLYIGIISVGIFGGFLLTRIYLMIKHKNITPFVISAITIFNILFTSITFKFSVINKAISSDQGVILIFISGLVLVISFSALVSYQLDFISGIIHYLLQPFHKSSFIAKIAIRYPSENKLRTGLTFVMFSLIIYILVFVTVMISINKDISARSINKSFGGFDAFVIPNPFGNTQNLALTLQNNKAVKEVASLTDILITLPEYQYKNLSSTTNSHDLRPQKQDNLNSEDNFATTFNVLPAEYIHNMEITLVERSAQFTNDKQAWQAVIDDPQNVILGHLYASDSLGKRPELKVGDTIKIADIYNNQISTKKIIGKIKNNQRGGRVYSDLLVSTKVLTEFSPKYIKQNSGQMLLLRKSDNIINNDFGKTIRTLLIKENVVTIIIVDDIKGLVTAIINGFGMMFQGFLAFNLIVGISGLAIIMIRSVNERRQQIGMLRSLGWQRKMILVSFTIETTFITILSIIIGVSMGIVSVFNIVKSLKSDYFTIELIIPWSQIAILCIGVYVVALIFSALPTIKAAHLSPVEATNYPE